MVASRVKRERGQKRRRRFVGAIAQRPMARPVLRRTRALAYVLGVEKKFFDTSLVASSISLSADATGGEKNPSSTITLNTVVQGEGEQNRDGRKIIMKYISVKGLVKSGALNNQTVSGSQVRAKVYLVLDTQTNGTLVASENVFTNPSASTAGTMLMFRNMKFASRFRVLAVEELSLNWLPMTGSGADIEIGQMQDSFKFNVMLPDIPVNYTSTEGTVANISDNSLNIIAFAQNDSGIQTVNLTYNARLRFVG